MANKNQTLISDLRSQGFTVLTPSQASKLNSDFSRIREAQEQIESTLAVEDPKALRTIRRASGNIGKIAQRRLSAV